MSTFPRSPHSLFPPVRQPQQYEPPPPVPPRIIPLHEIPRIPDRESPSSDWLPIYNKRSNYDETEIVHLIHDIVRNYLRLSAVSEDEVIWPPTEGAGHLLDIDEILCDELHISDSVKSLIRRLPSPARDARSPIFLYKSSRLFNITDQDNGDSLRRTRESPLFNKDRDPSADNERYLKPYEIQLSGGDIDDLETPILILDTRENTIRVETRTTSPPGTPPEQPTNPPSYHNPNPNQNQNQNQNHWPINSHTHAHAPSFLRTQTHRMKTLDIIPIIPPGRRVEYESRCYIDFTEEWMRRKMKLSLEGTYGWPDNFQQSAWDRDRERVWAEVEEEYRRLGRPSVLRCL
ncbi:643a2637-e35f-4dc7-b51b-9ab199fc994d [Sclerotinia trifoliorum]|uniref:643a2637-e35f-4dc7-b51b-9ab199fc994d n=1 Tax=Sclerotinia trifoliorum TaxID=28548 RepID=A0A8H2ZNE3_9HELO|nr:643a2637-e35f-4dc7-b51b-9ab199fc994d [Sclerotinia trifoliorum]